MTIPINQIHSISIPEAGGIGAVEVRMHNSVDAGGVPETLDGEIYQSIIISPEFSIYIMEKNEGPVLLIEI